MASKSCFEKQHQLSRTFVCTTKKLLPLFGLGAYRFCRLPGSLRPLSIYLSSGLLLISFSLNAFWTLRPLPSRLRNSIRKLRRLAFLTNTAASVVSDKPKIRPTTRGSRLLACCSSVAVTQEYFSSISIILYSWFPQHFCLDFGAPGFRNVVAADACRCL